MNGNPFAGTGPLRQSMPPPQPPTPGPLSPAPPYLGEHGPQHWPGPYQYRPPPLYPPTTLSGYPAPETPPPGGPDGSEDNVEVKKKGGKGPKKEVAEDKTASEEEIEACLTRLGKCVPGDALTESEKALFFENIRTAFPTHLTTLRIVSATSRTNTNNERYHYLALISTSSRASFPKDRPQLEVLVESGKFRGRHQEKMGGAKEAESEGPTFEALMFRSLFCAVEEVVEERLMESRIRDRDG